MKRPCLRRPSHVVCPATSLLMALFADLASGSGQSVNPRAIQHHLQKCCPYIADGSQHDAHEFFVGRGVRFITYRCCISRCWRRSKTRC